MPAAPGVPGGAPGARRFGGRQASGSVDSEEDRTALDAEAEGALPAGCTYRSGLVVEAPSDEVAAAEAAIENALIEPVQFTTGTATFVGTSMTILDNVAATLNEYPSLTLRVEGHTDNTGDAAMNQQLSQERAEAVMVYLTEQGVAAERLSAVGYGQNRPVAGNDTDAGRAQNRRVAFTVNP